MNKFLIFLFVFSMFAFKSFADQPYFLVEINCYPKSEYFEIRYFETHNLEMNNNKNENNLYNLSAYLKDKKTISDKCKINKQRIITYELKPLGNLDWKNCYFSDAFFSINLKGEKEYELIKDLRFSNQQLDEKCSEGFGNREGSRVTNFQYFAKDNYFTLTTREEVEKGIMKIKERTIFIDSPYNSDANKLPLNSLN